MREKPAKYDVYEKVRIVSVSPGKQEIYGAAGVVLGRAQSELGEHFYSVYLYRTKECWSLREEEMAPTGEYDDCENFYDGSTLHVRAAADEGPLKVKE